MKQIRNACNRIKYKLSLKMFKDSKLGHTVGPKSLFQKEKNGEIKDKKG